VPKNPDEANFERQMEAWAAQSETELSPEVRSKIQGKLTASIAPVSPIASQQRLVLSFFAMFIVGAVGLAAAFDKPGLHLMSAMQMGGMAVVFGVAGILFSEILAFRMVPGSRSRFPFSLVMWLSGLEIIAAIAALFSWKPSPAFVSEGWPCAVLELVIAIPATFLFWLFARRGALFPSAGLGAALTALPLSLVLVPVQTQCMFPQAPHLLVWHAGVAATAVGFGSLIGGLKGHRATR
jgi:hypothetical protein